MNKKDYQRAFSVVRPSDEAMERIFTMTEQKKKRIRFKPLLIAAIITVLFSCAAFSANAATDGAIFEDFKLVLNGETVDFTKYLKSHKSYVDDYGTNVDEYEFDMQDNDGAYVISKVVTNDKTMANNELEIVIDDESESTQK